MTPTQKEAKAEMKTKAVYYGDCLTHLTQWCNWNNEPGRIKSLADLIYLDPPWNSNAKYNILWDKGDNANKGHTAQAVAFTDIWHWSGAAAERVNRICRDNEFPYKHPNSPYHSARQSIRGLNELIPETGMLAYVSYMAERLALLRLMLKETGSIYLHCDPTASHYLKLVMDDIFGQKCFRNELIWHYFKPHSSKSRWPRNFDVLLHYGKSRQISAVQKSKHYKTKFNHEATLFEYDEKSVNRYDKVDEEGKRYKIYTDKKGVVRKAYMKEGVSEGVLRIPFVQGTSKEYLGYPTQKPLALLERIIKASSDKGDIVLDPFCGCGTTMEAAALLKREFVGVDISLFAVNTVTKNRMSGSGFDVDITGIPSDLASARALAEEDKFKFETFAVETCHPGFIANKVQRGDGGMDGKGVLLHPVKHKGKEKDLILVQVKGGKQPSIESVRAFAHNIEYTEGAIAGVFITLEEYHWKKGMQKIADQLGTFKHERSATEYPRLQHWHIGQNDLKLKKTTMWKGFPILPELSNPLSGKELIIEQPTFWHRI